MPHVTDVDEALKPDAPVVQPRHSKEGQPANQTARMEFGHGDVDEGLKEADVVVEKSFKTGQTHWAILSLMLVWQVLALMAQVSFGLRPRGTLHTVTYVRHCWAWISRNLKLPPRKSAVVLAARPMCG